MGVEPEAVFEAGRERRHSEPNEQQSDKSKQHLQKFIFLKPFGAQKSDIFDLRCSKSFSKMCFPQQRETHFYKIL